MSGEYAEESLDERPLYEPEEPGEKPMTPKEGGAGLARVVKVTGELNHYPPEWAVVLPQAGAPNGVIISTADFEVPAKNMASIINAAVEAHVQRRTEELRKERDALKARVADLEAGRLKDDADYQRCSRERDAALARVKELESITNATFESETRKERGTQFIAVLPEEGNTAKPGEEGGGQNA
jgi:hypothetical protein